ncbi:alpha/beta hydrolase family esterase [Gemmatimonadota bacterium]
MTSNTRWFTMVGASAMLAILAACSSEFSFEPARPDLDRVDTLQSGGVARTFGVHLPPDYETVASPVVILFHRTGGNGLDMRYLTDFDVDANYYGFLAAYPDATSDWAYGCDCTTAEADGIDDVQFVVDLLDDLDADYGINRDSVFVVGFSEGGFMAQKAVCDATDSFAGMATVAATMPVPLAESCVPTREIPVLMIHGTEDTVFPWDGALDRGLESVLAADTTAQFWATSNGCGDRLERQYVMRDTYYSLDVYRDAFDACPVSGNVLLYRMDGPGAVHGWPNGYFSASYEISGFFVGEQSELTAPASFPRE